MKQEGWFQHVQRTLLIRFSAIRKRTEDVVKERRKNRQVGAVKEGQKRVWRTKGGQVECTRVDKERFCQEKGEVEGVLSYRRTRDWKVRQGCDEENKETERLALEEGV